MAKFVNILTSIHLAGSPYMGLIACPAFIRPVFSRLAIWSITFTSCTFSQPALT